MVPQAFRGLARTRTNFSQLLHSFRKLVTNTYLFLFSPSTVALKVVFSVWFVQIPITAPHAPAPPHAPLSSEITLNRDQGIFSDGETLLVIMPGESNAARESRERMQKQIVRTRAAGLSLRPIDEAEMSESIRDFLVRKRSPLASHAVDFVEAGQHYNIDPRLLVGIAGIESSFGLHMPYGSHNPFGLGPHLRFRNFRDAIFAEAAFLHRYFTSRGVMNPHRIGPSYTGTGSTSWGVAVARFMTTI